MASEELRQRPKRMTMAAIAPPRRPRRKGDSRFRGLLGQQAHRIRRKFFSPSEGIGWGSCTPRGAADGELPVTRDGQRPDLLLLACALSIDGEESCDDILDSAQGQHL